MASGGSGSGTTSKNDDSKWYFTAEQLASSPSRKAGMDADQELMYRQRAANLIQDMGQRLQVSQLCINTAIVYMHRFYAFHSFTQFHRNSIAAAALFLAAKVEEQPRKLEHIIKVVHMCLGLDAPEPTRENYAEQAQDLVFNENVLLQTLGFDVAIDHPHTHVVKTCHLVKASKDLAQTSYFMASNSLHLTTMCLQYKPTVVACFCIHLACKWSRWEIPQSNEGRHWFHYVDKTVTLDLLKQLTNEFLHIFDRCPTRLKNKMKSIRADSGAEESGRRAGGSSSSSSSLMAAPSSSSVPRSLDESSATTSSSSSHHRPKQGSSSDMMKPHGMSSSGSHQKVPSSSSSGSRSRSDRPPPASLASSSSLAGQQPQQQQPAQHYGSGSSSSSNSNNNKGAPSISSHRGSMPMNATGSAVPSQRSSSSSAAAYQQGHDGSKSRQQPSSVGGMIQASGGSAPNQGAVGGTTSSSSSMHSGYNQMKTDRHSGQKLPPKAPSSASGSTVAPNYNAKHQQQQQQQQPPQQQPPSSLFSHPPSYNQSISGRASNLPLTDQQSSSSGSSNSSSNQPKTEPSSFRLLDESIGRLTDPMQICTPPKQSKPSSIFSPDWKDSQNESLQPNTLQSSKSRSSSSAHYGNVPGAGSSDRLLKPPKGSPSSKKQQLQQQQQQQQQQHHGSAMGSSRSDTQKKERRMDSTAGQQQAPGSGKHPSLVHDKKSLMAPGASGALPMGGGSNSISNTTGSNNGSNSHTSHNLKRSLDGTIIPPNALAGNDGSAAIGNLAGNGAPGSMATNTHSSGSSSSSSGMSSQAKRPHPSNEQIRQDDGTDFREQKMRRTEQSSSSSFLSAGSPSDQLFNSSFDLASTFDKMDDSSSLFNFNDPGSLLSQPLLSDSKPSTLAKSGGIFSNTINGIETNAALVSSLLKESLFNETPKFGSLYGAAGSAGNEPSAGTRSDTVDTKPSIDTAASVTAMDTKPPITSMGGSLHGLPPVSVGGTQQQLPAVSGASDSTVPPSYPWVTTNAATLPGDASGNVATSQASVQPTAATIAAPADPTTQLPLAAAATIAAASTASDPDTDQGAGGHRSKSEKKKKKEKHKHKEKDKTKDRDREEKKKHKKDKDKHRDREHREKGDHQTGLGSDVGGAGLGHGGSHSGQDTQPPPGPIKIKLNRAIIPPVMDGGSVAGSSGSSTNDGLKIKIPKDRLSGSSTLPGGPATSISGGSGHGGSSHGTTGIGGGSASLKLKISKDKIEHYNISAPSDTIGQQQQQQHLTATSVPAGLGGIGMGGIGGSSSSSSSNKKKDREKDREKSKSKSSSSSSEHGNRQNGGGSVAPGNNSSKSSSKNLSNLPQQQTQLQQQQQYGIYNPNQSLAAANASMAATGMVQGMHGYHHQASGFDYLQQQQQQQQSVAALQQQQQQQQQFYAQYGHFGQQQQQQAQQFQQQMAASGANSMLMNASGAGVSAGMMGKLTGQPGTTTATAGMQSSALPPYYYGGGSGAATNQGAGKK